MRPAGLPRKPGLATAIYGIDSESTDRTAAIRAAVGAIALTSKGRDLRFTRADDRGGMAYNRRFFELEERFLAHAASVLTSAVLEIVDVESVVDVGCGTGRLLSGFMEHGITDVLGIDGYCPSELLAIPAGKFLTHDLSVPFKTPKRYTIACCLEVAEHLPPIASKAIVETLTNLADVVIFSAAIPGQGGSGHVNEQWQSYWIRLFSEHGFIAHRELRDALWGRAIPFWYRQNIILFTSSRIRHDQLKKPLTYGDHECLFDVVHPDFYSRCALPGHITIGKWFRVAKLGVRALRNMRGNMSGQGLVNDSARVF